MAYTIERVDVTTLDRALIAHGVNCQSAMGSGIAGALARKWPQVRSEYLEYTKLQLEALKACRSPWSTTTEQEDRWSLQGRVHYVQVSSDIIVANCFTQHEMGADGKKYASVTAIDEALNKLFGHIIMSFDQDIEVPPIYMPQIGCGLGGLSWDEEVKPVYDYYADQLPHIPFTVCVL